MMTRWRLIGGTLNSGLQGRDGVKYVVSSDARTVRCCDVRTARIGTALSTGACYRRQGIGG